MGRADGRFATSSLTVAEFCAAEGVSVPAFYQWKRVLAAGDAPVPVSTSPTFIPPRCSGVGLRNSAG